MTTAVRLLVLSAALLCLRWRAWRPIGLALAGSVGADWAAELAAPPPDLDLLLWMAPSVLSAWCAWRVLGGEHAALLAVAALVWPALVGAKVLVSALPAGAWVALPLAMRLYSIGSQLAAATWWGCSTRPGSSADAAVLAMFAGDLLSLLGPAGFAPGPWWIATAQAGVVGAGVLALVAARAARS